MLVECNHCGAPLDVSGRESVVACAYCNRQHRLPRMKTIAPDTPIDWKPPKVWTPPEEARARSRPLKLHPVKVLAGVVWTVRRLLGFVLSMALLVGGLALVVLPALSGTDPDAVRELGAAVGDEATREQAKQKLGALKDKLLADGKLDKLVEAASEAASRKLGELVWTGEEPYVCEGNSSATLRGVTASFEGRTAIEARGNCELRVVGCTLEAWEGLSIADNAEVVLEGSHVSAKGKGVTVSGNASLQLVDTTVDAGKVGIEARDNARLLLATGRVAGGDHSVVLHDNARGELREATLDGKARTRGRLEGYPR